jgi:SNF2 family DNA or RNA helicase
MNKLPSVIQRQIPDQILSAGFHIFERGDYKFLDFIRDSYTAQFSDKRGSYWAILKNDPTKRGFIRLCSCNTFLQHMSCPHVTAMLFFVYSRNPSSPELNETLSKFHESSIWCNLAKLCYEHYSETKLNIYARLNSSATHPEIKLLAEDKTNTKIFEFIVPEAYLMRLVQKYRYKFFETVSEKELPWQSFEKNLEYLQPEKTEIEIRMNESGYKSWLQKFEDSYWFDFSKAWFFGFGDKGYSVEYLEKRQSLKIFSEDNQFNFFIPKPQVASILIKLAQNESIRKTLNISDKKLVLNYSLEVTKDFNLIVAPLLECENEKKPLFLSTLKTKPVLLGKFIYLKNKGFFPFERKISYYDSTIFNFDDVQIPNDKIPDIIRENRKYINAGDFYKVSPSLKKREFADKIKGVDVFVDELKDDWLYLSVKYRIGNETITLYDIYCAFRDGKRFVIGKNFWIDLHQIDFNWIRSMINDESFAFEISEKTGISLKMSKMNFIKMNAHLPVKSKINSKRDLEQMVNKLTNFKPISISPSLEKCNYKLRDYQNSGYEWMWFLYENNLSGLLCDDMGLGKTYQSLGLIDAITFLKNTSLKFFVVAPTSVLPHWEEKLKQLKKKVHFHLYYGSDRQLKSLKKEKYSVVLTSYGTLRNDLNELAKIDFELAIFDEIQTAKNKASLTNAALNQLNSRIRIGLTGTPIENTLAELKALFDIVLPEYLGGDYSFRKNYIVPIERQENKQKLEELYKIIKPFMLRRTKKQVLLELPPKTEEVRKCQLSPDQQKRYQEVLNARAKSLLAQLYNEDEGIPYIHIFAVLNQLKQVCNHPAQMDKKDLNYKKYESGKWDLFIELLEESLNSGFKIVVFSQFLNMLALIESYLKEKNIEFATIKGATKNRKEMLDRFNKDPQCKVFSGSLRAAGLGVDLIGGSVVIHYDRWWNAAREDQATDRVHRIGQTRGVQVFKLVTEGTLEEKIDRMIAKKKKLMDELVREDDANIVKHFSRDELIDLLTFR